MKKIACLLAILYIGGIGFVQTVYAYDYDRIPPTEMTSSEPSLWFKIDINSNEQVVPLPSEASYGRIILHESEVDTGDMLVEFKDVPSTPHQLQVSKTYKLGMDMQYRQQNAIIFKLEGNGETVVEENGVKEYTKAYLVKMIWKDPDGETHEKYIAKVY